MSIEKATNWQYNSDTRVVKSVKITDTPWDTDPKEVRLNERVRSIEFVNAGGGTLYDIDLDKMEDTRGFLEAIFRVNGKSWCSPQTLAAVLTICRSIMYSNGAVPGNFTREGFRFSKKVGK